MPVAVSITRSPVSGGLVIDLVYFVEPAGAGGLVFGGVAFSLGRCDFQSLCGFVIGHYLAENSFSCSVESRSFVRNKGLRGFEMFCVAIDLWNNVTRN